MSGTPPRTPPTSRRVVQPRAPRRDRAIRYNSIGFPMVPDASALSDFEGDFGQPTPMEIDFPTVPRRALFQDHSEDDDIYGEPMYIDQEEEWEPMQLDQDVEVQVKRLTQEYLENEKKNYPPTKTSKQEREKYYVSVLGEDYRSKTIFNTIMQEDVRIGDYLDEDEDNIIFVLDGSNFVSSRALTGTVLPLYECEHVDSMSVIYDKKYITLSNIGCPCIGVADYDAFRTVVTYGDYQIFQLRLTPIKTKTLVSHAIIYMDDDLSSDWHCQSGSQMSYYQLYVPSSKNEK